MIIYPDEDYVNLKDTRIIANIIDFHPISYLYFPTDVW